MQLYKWNLVVLILPVCNFHSSSNHRCLRKKKNPSSLWVGTCLEEISVLVGVGGLSLGCRTDKEKLLICRLTISKTPSLTHLLRSSSVRIWLCHMFSCVMLFSSEPLKHNASHNDMHEGSWSVGDWAMYKCRFYTQLLVFCPSLWGGWLVIH